MLGVSGAEHLRNGNTELLKEHTTRFFTAARAFDAWQAEGDNASLGESDFLPVGDSTPVAFTAFTAVKTKISDWFMRCDIGAFDTRATAHLNCAEAAYQALAGRNLAEADDDIGALPLQQVVPGADLCLTQGINPAWVPRIQAFRSAVAEPILGAGITTMSGAALLGGKERALGPNCASYDGCRRSPQPARSRRQPRVLIGDADASERLSAQPTKGPGGFWSSGTRERGRSVVGRAGLEGGA